MSNISVKTNDPLYSVLVQYRAEQNQLHDELKAKYAETQAKKREFWEAVYDTHSGLRGHACNVDFDKVSEGEIIIKDFGERSKIQRDKVLDDEIDLKINEGALGRR